jgi:hypothetical protein
MRVYRRHSVNSRAVHHFEDLAGKLLEVSKTEFDERRNAGETGGPTDWEREQGWVEPRWGIRWFWWCAQPSTRRLTRR